MSEQEAMQQLIDRYDCEIYQSPWGVNAYYREVHLQISFEEALQKWGNGNIWVKNKQVWSTGEFARSDKLTSQELFALLDTYLPKKAQMSLF